MYYIYNYEEYERVINGDYSCLHNEDIERNERGYYLGTGIKAGTSNGTLFFTTDLNKAPYNKVLDLKVPKHLHIMKFFQALNNKYIPIYDDTTHELLFTLEEFNEIRKQMSGLKEYDAGEFMFSNNLAFDGMERYTSQVDKNLANIAIVNKAINERTKAILTELGLVENSLDKEDGFRIIDTGSTGRGTNNPFEKFDFDYVIRLKLGAAEINEYSRRRVFRKIENVKYALTGNKQFGFGYNKEAGALSTSLRLRLKEVAVEYVDCDGVYHKENFDLDFSFYSNEKEYTSTEDAIMNRLETIKEQAPLKYKMVLANIMYAKEVLKEAHAYKPHRSDATQGGLGGVGVENWILAHGGSFIDASLSFYNTAKKYIEKYNIDLNNVDYYSDYDNTSDAYKAFIEFQGEYAVYDFGKNHQAVSARTFPYDNFVMKNMRIQGFLRMYKAIENKLEYLNNLGYIENTSGYIK